MGNLKDIHRVAQNLQRLNFDQVIRSSFEEVKGNIGSFNKDNLKQGLLVDGSPIRPELQSIPYAAAKFNKNGQAPFGTPDLYLTGAFQEGIGTIINSKSFTTFSTDDKSSKLELKYSPKIFGLPDNKRADFVKVLTPVIIRNFKQASGL